MMTPMRRMIREVLYDSIVTTGHLFEPKHAASMNLKTVWRQSQITRAPRAGEPEGNLSAPTTIAQPGTAT